MLRREAQPSAHDTLRNKTRDGGSATNYPVTALMHFIMSHSITLMLGLFMAVFENKISDMRLSRQDNRVFNII